MASNPTSVLVSIKPLCPEVDDYWLSVPADVMTIDGLKRHILSSDCILKDMDDVDLYLSDGLLRGHSSIAGVLLNRDRIEMRIKYMDKKRINSSADSTSGHYKCKCVVNECITVEDSDDETMGDRTGVQTIVTTESICGNQLNCDSKPLLESSTSVANHLDTEFSAPKVVIKSEFKYKTDTTGAEKSMINEYEDKMAEKVIVKSESNGSGDCPTDSTASQSSATLMVTQSGDECHTKDVAMQTISADNTVSHKSTKNSSTESITRMDSDKGSMSYRSGVQTVVKIENTSGNQLNCDRKPSIDSFIFSSPPKVVFKSEFKYITDIMKAETLSNAYEDTIGIAKSESNGSGDCPHDSTASISSATAVVTQSGDECHTKDVAMEAIGADNTVSHKSTKSSSTESRTCVVDSDDEPLSIRYKRKTRSTNKVIVKSESRGESVECAPNCTASQSVAVVIQSVTNSVARNEKSPESSHQIGGHKYDVFQCRRRGCDYESRCMKRFTRHECGRYRKCYRCVGRVFSTKSDLTAHHSRSHVDHSAAAIQWFDCPINGCMFKIKDLSKNSKHMLQYHKRSSKRH